MSDKTVPIYMNGKIIGEITVDSETGGFTGEFESDAMDILREAMKSNANNVTLENIFGLFAHTHVSTAERWAAYLSRPVAHTKTDEQEYWSVYDSETMKRIVRNLPSELEARLRAQDLHLTHPMNSYTWLQQPEKHEGAF